MTNNPKDTGVKAPVQAAGQPSENVVHMAMAYLVVNDDGHEQRVPVLLSYRKYENSGNEGFFGQVPKFLYRGRTLSGSVTTYLSPKNQEHIATE